MSDKIIKILYYIIHPEEKLDQVVEYKQVSSLFKAHSLEPFLWYAKKLGLVICTSEEEKEINFLHQTSIYRTMVQEEEYKFIKKELSKAEIAFLPLKGFIIRDCYPSIDMRNMADVDILVQIKELKKIKTIMKSLNYDLVKQGGNHDVYQKKPCMNVEIHRDMIDESIEFSNYYKDIWKKIEIKENGSECFLKDEDNYLFIIAHSAKHYYAGGIGVRFVLDIYFYLKKYKSLDREYIDKELEKLNLKEYEKRIFNLANGWFDKETLTVDDAVVGDYILSSGIYGRIDNAVQAAIANDDSSKSIKSLKRKYFFKKAFPSFKEMKRKYPSLKIWFLLLPFYYMHRIIKAIFKGNAIEEVKQLNKVDEVKIKSQKNIKEKTK